MTQTTHPQPSAGLDDRIRAIEAYLDTTADERLDDYREFLRIPSISTLSENQLDVRAAADFVADHLRAAGIEHVEVSRTKGHPIVYGDWLHAEGAPTVLVYGHYDVQPVDPLDLWDRPPFEPAVEAGRMYARGAADDKGQVHFHLWALKAWHAVHGGLPVNLRFVFEGEEESGSTNFDEWIVANQGRLAAEVIPHVQHS